MGHPRKIKKKYSTPSHPWQRKRMESESELIAEYGLVNKKELWKFVSKLKRYKKNAKKLIASSKEQAKIEEKQMLEKLAKLNLVGKGAKIEDALDIDLKSLLDRRLQSQVVKHGFARTMRQARQFIVHEHIKVGDNRVNVPSYLVYVDEEDKIGFADKSPFKDDMHPERTIEKKGAHLKGKDKLPTQEKINEGEPKEEMSVVVEAIEEKQEEVVA